MRRLHLLLLATAAACLTLVPEGLAQRGGGRSGAGSSSRTHSASSGGGSSRGSSGVSSGRSSGGSSVRSSGSPFQGSSSRSGGYRAPAPTVGRAPSAPPTIGAPSRPVYVPSRPSVAPTPSYEPRPSSPTTFSGRDSSGRGYAPTGIDGRSQSGGAASSVPYNGRADAPLNRVLDGSGSRDTNDSTRTIRNDGDLGRSQDRGGRDDDLDRVFVDLRGAARSPRVPFPQSYSSTLYERRASEGRLEAIAQRGRSQESSETGTRFGAVGAAGTGGATLRAPSIRYGGTGFTAADRARNGGPLDVEPGTRGQYARGPLDRLAYPHRTVEDIARGADRIRVPSGTRTEPAPAPGARTGRPAAGTEPTRTIRFPRTPGGEATREGVRELAERDPADARRIGSAGRAMARAQGAALEAGLGTVIGTGQAHRLARTFYTVPTPRKATGPSTGGHNGYPTYPYCGPKWGKSYFHFGFGFYFGGGSCWAYTPYFWAWCYPYYYYHYWYPWYYPYYWAYYPSYPAYPAAYYGGVVYNYYYGGSSDGGTVYYDEPVGEAVGGSRVVAGEDAQQPATASLNSAAQRYLTLGDRAFREGRFNDAVTFYAKAIEFEPDRGVLHLILADALFATGDYHYAAYSIRRALDLDPSLVDSVVDKHAFYADPAEFDRQLAVLENYVSDHPQDDDARLVLATNLLFGNRPAAAVDLLEGPFSAALRADPAAQLVLQAARAVQYGDLNALQPAQEGGE